MNFKIRRNWRERFCPEFRRDIEKSLRAAEAAVWQPHWSHEDPMPDRLARAGCDQDTIRWITWWLDAFDKMQRGERPDRSDEPNIPEGVSRLWKSETEERQRTRRKKDRGRRSERPDQDTLCWMFWTIFWGMDSLDDDGEPLTIPTFADTMAEVDWHVNNLLFGSVTSPSVRFFRKYVDDNPDTVLEDFLLLGRQCGFKVPRHPALVQLDRIVRSASSRNRKKGLRKRQP